MTRMRRGRRDEVTRTRTGGAGEGEPCADHEERKEEDVWGLEAGMQRRC